MKNFRKYLSYILLALLFIIAVFTIYFIYHKDYASNMLKVAYLDIGQGDAIYIEAPNGRQMLIDGGPGPIVLSKLGAVMPFGDRTIDMIVITNPDADHIAGFIDVISNYTVGRVLEPGTFNKSMIYQKLEDMIASHDIKKEIARRGMEVILDKEKNIHFDILFPDRDVSSWTSNDGSIVGKLVYGDQSFMMMGDATKYTELLVKQNETPETLHARVLKLGHHGSHTSSSELWLESVQPNLAIISAGLHNRYGHPHQDILDRLASLHIPYMGTYQKGTIILKSDGLKIFQ
jgi:competence protein ComEC